MDLSYIPNEFARGWIANEKKALRKGVLVRLAYIDINDGHHEDALMFSRIMFWHEPNRDTGKRRMRRFRDGHFWITKQHRDWWDECRISQRSARRCLDRLKSRNLIYYELHGEAGKPCPWIRINWDEFERRMKFVLNEQEVGAQASQFSTSDTNDDEPSVRNGQGGGQNGTGASQNDQGADQSGQSFDQNGQGTCPEWSEAVSETVDSNTGTTPGTTSGKTTGKTEETHSAPASARSGDFSNSERDSGGEVPYANDKKHRDMNDEKAGGSGKAEPSLLAQLIADNFMPARAQLSEKNRKALEETFEVVLGYDRSEFLNLAQLYADDEDGFRAFVDKKICYFNKIKESGKRIVASNVVNTLLNVLDEKYGWLAWREKQRRDRVIKEYKKHVKSEVSNAAQYDGFDFNWGEGGMSFS